ncbi:MAG: hypothetical protein AAGF59_05760 [Pseudomonadota bacterium]
MASRLRFNTASEVFEAFPTAYEDITASPNADHPLRFLEGLLSSPVPEEAITFCAYMLPRREAVWWARQCVTYNGAELSAEEQDLVAIADAWVRDPDEENRVQALRAGMNARVKSAGAWVALAAGWSGGSMALDAEHPVPPPPHLTAKASNAAVLSALARVSTQQRAEYLSAFVDGGIKLVADNGQSA